MQKESRSVMFFALMFFVVGVGLSFAAWDGKSTEKPATETIDKKEFYLIKNEANLAWFRDSVNKVKGVSSINAKLTASLDMGGKLFLPIAAGSNEAGFGGIFDGNGFTVSNLYLHSEELGKIPNEFCPEGKPQCNAQNVGFVGVLMGGTVKNLNLENVYIAASASIGVGSGNTNPVSVGPVVGFLPKGVVDNCFASGTILTSGKGNGIGGLVGNAWDAKITNSLSTIDIWVSGDDSYVGGVLGYARNTGKVSIDACVYDGSILINSGNGVAGGAIGFFEAGDLSTSRIYFDKDVIETGVGKTSDGLSMEGSVSGVKNANIGKVVCDLNGGQWSGSECSKDGIWSIGATRIVHNGVSLDAAGNVVYEILFDANGGAFSGNDNFKKFLRPGDLITADEISTPIRSDTVFGGWALAPDAAEPVENLGTIDGPKTIYAYWKNMFEITFDANGGTFPGEGTPATVTKKVAEGEAIDVSGIDLPTTYTSGDETFYFAGWAKSSEATTQEDLGNATATTTFYAIWTKLTTYTVVFNTQRNSGTTVAYVQEGSKVSKPTNPVAKGYTFGEWYGDKDCSESQKFDFDTEITGNVTLYAKWAPETYKIAYELGDGAKNNKANPETYTVETETIVLKKPSRTGYTFEGWYYDKKFSMPAVQITEGSTGDKSLFAKWSVKTFPIVYMAGSYGVEVVPSDVKQYDVPINLRGASYTREGYLQDGWSTKNGGSKVYELDAVYKQNSTLTLYPYWVEDPTYKKDPSSIRDFASVRIHGFGIVVQNRGLEITNVKPGAIVSVMDMQGRLVRKGVAGSTRFRVTGLVPGNYVVRVNGVVRQARIR